MSLLKELTWQRWAECRDLPPELFFPDNPLIATRDNKAARAVCAVCPVRIQCGEYAIAEVIDHGIWGGMTPRERRQERVRRARARKTQDA